VIQEVTLPWPAKELSPNARVHYMVLARAKKAYRVACFALARQARLADPGGLIRVEMTFYPPTRHARDDDNLIASMKSGLDGLADAMGVNDKRFKIKPPKVSEQLGGMVKVQISHMEETT
jgi:crossover junction endodeoxyribonuclease RusA